jgi:hypothetical protein
VLPVSDSDIGAGAGLAGMALPQDAGNGFSEP